LVRLFAENMVSGIAAFTSDQSELA
jgi:hypothetical protein